MHEYAGESRIMDGFRQVQQHGCLLSKLDLSITQSPIRQREHRLVALDHSLFRKRFLRFAAHERVGRETALQDRGRLVDDFSQTFPLIDDFIGRRPGGSTLIQHDRARCCYRRERISRLSATDALGGFCRWCCKVSQLLIRNCHERDTAVLARPFGPALENCHLTSIYHPIGW